MIETLGHDSLALSQERTDSGTGVTHLPECWYSDPDKVPAGSWRGYPCICNRLRACEQRMLDDDVPAAAYHGEKGYTMGYIDALDAAEAVAKKYDAAFTAEAIRSLKEKP